MVLVCSTLAVLIATACPDHAQPVAEVPAPIAATPAPTATAASLKQVAILGAPSRLQMMAMQQSGAAAPLPGSGPAAAQAYAPRAAVLQEAPRFTLHRNNVPAAADRPNIFGTSAVPVARTSLDAKWRRVSVHFSKAIPAARQLASGSEASALAKLELVNSWVNRRVQFVSDIRATGQSDLWSSAAETLSRGRGDCEDYAIAKLQLLKALGFSSDDLYFAVVRDLVRRADHAVLVVRVDGRFVVLDNNVDRVLDSSEVADYRPVITYAASGKAFVHGYQQPVRMASAEARVSPAAN